VPAEIVEGTYYLVNCHAPLWEGERARLATTRLIREHRPEQAIILYTAYLDEVLERDAEQAGVALCVEKIDGITTLERDIRRVAEGLF
jgi:hypothetical protein